MTDSWERVEEDAAKRPCEYFGFDGAECADGCPAFESTACVEVKAADLVRRRKALAGVE